MLVSLCWLVDDWEFAPWADITGQFAHSFCMILHVQTESTQISRHTQVCLLLLTVFPHSHVEILSA